MHSHSEHTHFSLVISIVVAVSIHIVILAGLYALLNRPELPIEKTVPSIILNPSIAQRAEQSEASTATAHSDRHLVSTTSESEFTISPPIPDKAEPAQETVVHPQTRPQQPDKSPAKQQSVGKAPAVSVPTTSSQQRNAPNQPQLRSLFQQAATDQTAEVEQISTKSVAELSDYERALLTQLSQEALYDEFHPIMLYNTKTQVDYVLSLRLFKNGAIRSATLAKSSGIEEIDRLAIQTAYQASPYPAPPAKDAAIDYRYQIPIIYDRLKLIGTGK
jgi:periplasmic protein TonB